MCCAEFFSMRIEFSSYPLAYSCPHFMKYKNSVLNLFFIYVKHHASHTKEHTTELVIWAKLKTRIRGIQTGRTGKVQIMVTVSHSDGVLARAATTLYKCGDVRTSKSAAPYTLSPPPRRHPHRSAVASTPSTIVAKSLSPQSALISLPVAHQLRPSAVTLSAYRRRR